MSAVFKHTTFLIVTLTLIGGFLRFYNLNWGAPYYFHPDERNIINSVVQLQYPNNLNPNFFAYGSLPIYTIYLTGLVINLFSRCQMSIVNCQLLFDQAVIISRFYAALLSTLLIPLVYLIGKHMQSKQVGLLAAFFTMTSVGLIQFAHFGTFEMWLTFFSALLFYCCLQLIHKPQLLYLFLTGLVLGALVGTKVSNLALLPLPFICLLLSKLKQSHIRHASIGNVAKISVQTALIFITAATVFIVSNPYSLLRYSAFRSTIQYESNVALGTSQVFYTQEFYTTIPVLFQFLHVYPFLINPFLTFLFIPSLFYIVWQNYKTKNKSYFILHIAFFILFLSQAFLFVKWVRYMVPTAPFIYLILSIAIIDFTKVFYKKYQFIVHISYFILLSICVLFAFSYYQTVLSKPDTRLAARTWASRFLSRDKPVMTEGYDLGTMPFNEVFSSMTACDMYTLETNLYPCNGKSLEGLRTESEYILLPSQRVRKSRILNKTKYPQGHIFYKSLFEETAGYQKIYETPCDIFCRILYMGDPVYAFEQTANVFDRPPVFLFKNQH